jgi:hypothetical protein
LGEIQLPLYLRRDMGDIGDHRKKVMGKGSCWSIKLAYLPQYNRFMGIGNEKEELLEML